MDKILKETTWKNCSNYNIYKNNYSIVIITNNEKKYLQNNHYTDSKNLITVLIDGNLYNKKDVENYLGLSKNNLPLPELIYFAFKKWGKDFIEYLNGDFSIIIYQKLKNEVLFFRDHLGIHPLAVSVNNEFIYFSTDPMGLAKGLYGNKRIDPSYLLNKFADIDYSGTLTPSQKILKIKPGHYLKVSPTSIQQQKYWFPEKIQTDHSLTQQQVLSDLEVLVRDAVNIRIDKTKLAGAHLSGGLDSGIVAALASKASKRQDDFFGFSWSPEESKMSETVSHDERILVEKTAEMNNIKVVYSSLDHESYQKFFTDWKHPSEMMYERKTVKAAKERGVNLIFSGWGGDEFISIGHRGIDADLIRQGDWKYFLKKYPPAKPRDFFRALIYSALFPSLRRKYSNFKCASSIYPYIKKEIGSNIIPKKDRFKYNSRQKVHLQLLEMGHLGARAADWYVFGQKNGIEYSYPLLDKRIIEYMLKVPSKCLVGDNHYRIILRKIGKNLLPQEVLINKSKDDPLKSKLFDKTVLDAKKQFINEFEDFRNNTDLAFVDFELLEKNIPSILENIEKGKENDGSDIFFYLKNAHEFTKGYYA